MTRSILVTLGPQSMTADVVRRCAAAGVTLFRLNLSHTKIEDLERSIRSIQSWTDVPVCLDSEGAQLRNQEMVSASVTLRKGDQITIHFEPVVGDSAKISFAPLRIARNFQVGDLIRVDFDHVEMKIIAIGSESAQAVITNGGQIGSNKAADCSRELPFEPLTSKDREAIRIGLQNGVRNFALSFANRREDVAIMRGACGPDANIICKIESPQGVANLERIMELADAILIDRGDLSRRVPIHKVPFLQRRIIAMARYRRCPVYVATNLLESMVTRRSPTRAEVNDVVSTLLMGADGLVLAAETAIGGYPVESVEMISRLVSECDAWTPNASISDILSDCDGWPSDSSPNSDAARN
jgi:pyruvate kinase